VDSSGNLFLSRTDGSVYFLNGKTGALGWTYVVTPYMGETLAAPVVTPYGIVIVSTTNGVFALGATNGQFVWTYGDGTTTVNPSAVVLDPNPAVQTVYWIGNSLAAVDGTSGLEYWVTDVSGGAPDAIVGATDVLVVNPGANGQGTTVTVTGYLSTSGVEDWSVLVFTGQSASTFLFQVDATNRVYVGYTSGSTTAVKCLDAAHGGALIWTANSIVTSPFGYIGTTGLYVGSTVGVQSYSLDTGNLQWSSAVGLTTIEAPIIAAPNGHLYIATGGLTSVRLAAVNERSGVLEWEFADPQARGVFGQPVFDSAGVLYIESFSTAGSTVYAVNPNTGKLITSYTYGTTVSAQLDTGLAIGKNTLFVGFSTQVVALVPGPSSSGTNAGAVAGGVIGALLGVGAVGAAVWYFKFKRPKAGYTDIGYSGSKV